MIVTKLLFALGIGFGYCFASVTTLITGASAVVNRGVRGGLAAGGGAALGLSVYAALAIAGLAMVQYFLRPAHLAVIEVVLGILFVISGFYLLVRTPRHRRRPAARQHDKPRGLWPYFATNLTLMLSGPQKIAYIAGLFLFFNLHVTSDAVKAFVPVAVLAGALLAWLLYTLLVARAGRRIADTRFVRNHLQRLGHLGHSRLFVAVRRVTVEKRVVRRLALLGKLLMIVVGAALAFKGAALLISWGFAPWADGAVHG